MIFLCIENLCKMYSFALCHSKCDLSRVQASSLDNHSPIPGKSQWPPPCIIIITTTPRTAYFWITFWCLTILWHSWLFSLTMVHWMGLDVGLPSFACFLFLNFLGAFKIEYKPKMHKTKDLSNKNFTKIMATKMNIAPILIDAPFKGSCWPNLLLWEGFKISP